MRCGVLSDVHANLPALRATLEELSRRGVDQLLVAGDLVGYGAQPNECVALLAERGAQCVLGNHDLFVLDRLPPTHFPDLARRSAQLHREWLSADVRSFLESLPTALTAGAVHMTHGSLDSPEEYVVSRPRALELLTRLADVAPGADTLVLGHTHQQWLVEMSGDTVPRRSTVMTATAPRLVNPGSVGQSRQRERRPRARCAVLEEGTGVVEFLRVDYDVAASRQVLQDHGLPDRCMHAPLRLRDTAGMRRVRAIARRVEHLLPSRGTDPA